MPIPCSVMLRPPAPQVALSRFTCILAFIVYRCQVMGRLYICRGGRLTWGSLLLGGVQLALLLFPTFDLLVSPFMTLVIPLPVFLYFCKYFCYNKNPQTANEPFDSCQNVTLYIWSVTFGRSSVSKFLKFSPILILFCSGRSRCILCLRHQVSTLCWLWVGCSVL